MRMWVCVACGLVRAQKEHLKPALVAFAAYIAGQVASTSTRKRGRTHLKKEVQGDLNNHDEWNDGIARALRWMRDRAACPMRDALLVPMQAKKIAMPHQA